MLECVRRVLLCMLEAVEGELWRFWRCGGTERAEVLNVRRFWRCGGSAGAEVLEVRRF